jgi:hypothetical protein
MTGRGAKRPLSSLKSERRNAPRYPARDALGVLGWWEGAHYQTARCLMLDLSQNGARVVSDEAPADPDTPIWLCLAGDQPSDWIAARAVEIRATPGQAYVVRMAFHEPCPYDVYKNVVPGFTFIPPPESQVEGEIPTDSRMWR